MHPLWRCDRAGDHDRGLGLTTTLHADGVGTNGIRTDGVGTDGVGANGVGILGLGTDGLDVDGCRADDFLPARTVSESSYQTGDVVSAGRRRLLAVAGFERVHGIRPCVSNVLRHRGAGCDRDFEQRVAASASFFSGNCEHAPTAPARVCF